MIKRLLWLRHETKPFEQRVLLTPQACQELIKEGHSLIVEDSPLRCFSTEEYKNVGCQIMPANSWITKAPQEAIIMGLKELEDKKFPLIHRHIHFAHAYKGQKGAREFLHRFQDGAAHFDLEYLVDENQKRIAAFGIWAGFTGAALGVLLWSQKRRGIDPNQQATLSPFASEQDLISTLKDNLKGLNLPHSLIIGANGRCGKGAKKLLEALDLKYQAWGSQETKGQGPFPKILNFDILINTVFIKEKIPPFLTKDIFSPQQKLMMISDVSCDPTGPFNPLPIYDDITTMDNPLRKVESVPEVYVTAIDHLPSLLPKESSEDFCQQLMPYLKDFLAGQIENTPWERSLEIFYKTKEKYQRSEESEALGAHETFC